MNPFTLPPITGERIVLERYKKRVMWRDVQFPDGKVHDFLIWGGTVNPSMTIALTDNLEVIAVRQYRPASHEIIIEIPGGCPDANENPLVVAGRELREETGYEPKEVVHLIAKMWPEPVSCATSFSLFLAKGCTKVAETKHDETELMEVIVVPLEKWIAMIYCGDICDGKTIAATFLALPHLGLEITAKK